MHLDFTADQDALRSSVRDVLDRECSLAVVRDRVEKGTPATELWDRIAELGWAALTLPEQVGGVGLGAVELIVVAEELGRHVAPLPWLSTVSQYAAIVRECGTPEQQQALLEPVAAGRTVGTLAVAEDAIRACPALPAVTARRDGSHWTLHGSKQWVWDASLAEEIAVVAAVDDGLGGFVVPAGDVGIEPGHVVDSGRELATVRLDGVRVSADRALGRPGESARQVGRALQEATLATAMEGVGACTALLDMTLDYVKTRRQFGVVIGSFQALKHRLADCYVALERARATAYFAAATLAEDDPRRHTAVSTAKVAAGDCQRRVVAAAIQCHGGVGYTWEADVHLLVKRAMLDEACFGTAHEHRRDLAAALDLRAAG